MIMIKKVLTFLLSLFFLLSQFHVNVVSTATRDYVLGNIDVERSSKNILVGSYIGGRSHLKPMLDIAALLIKKGHNVILLTSGNYTLSSEYPTIKQVTLGPALNYKKIQLNFDPTPEKKIKFFDLNILKMAYEEYVRKYKKNFEKYNSVAKDYNIDLFICDVMMNDACLDIAHSLKKPIVAFSSFINYIAPVLYKSDPMFGCNISLENESFLERLKCIVLRPLQIYYTIHPFLNQLNNLRKEVNVEVATAVNMKKVSLSLVDTFFGFELPQSLPPNVQEIGPILSEKYPSLTPELTNFINGHKRILYVAFGTRFYANVETNDKLLQSFIEAINRNIIDGVIWASAQTSKDSYSSILNLTDGSHIQTLSILNNEHPHIHISKFAPQFAVLNHTNTKLFLSHGGAGSTHESLYTGTPMLVLPFAADQLGNSDKLKTAGVALALNRYTLNVNDIINKIDFLLKDEKVKKNSKRMEMLTKINSKRKYRAADLIEYILYDSSLNEGVNEEFLKEWIPADFRMGFIKRNNYDIFGALLGIILGIIGGILWIIIKSIKFIIKRTSTFIQKLKTE